MQGKTSLLWCKKLKDILSIWANRFTLTALNENSGKFPSNKQK